MQYLTVEMSLYEITLLKSPSLATAWNQDFQLLELLYSCLQASKSFFDIFFSTPVTLYHCIPMPTFASLTRSLIVLQKLSVLEHPDWNLTFVRETLNFIDVLDSLIERFDQVKRAICFDPETSDGTDMFTRTATKIKCIKSFFEERMSLESSGQEAQTWNPEVTRTAELMDFFDELWLNDIMGPCGDYQFNPTV
jgi:hypothetical protein